MRSVRLFVNSNRSESEMLEQVLMQWSAENPLITTQIIPILEQPVEAVRLQIFFTPALVIDDEVVAMDVRSAETLLNHLNSVDCPKSDSEK